jgi:anti-sigma-K factor RskA
VSAPDARQALAALALGVLPPDEARRVEHDAGEDPQLARELETYRATVRALTRVLPAEPAPAHLFEAGRKMPRAWRLPTLRRRDLVVAAAGAAVVAAVGILALRGGGPEADARAEIIPGSGRPAGGEAVLYGTGRDDGRLVLRLRNVPAPEAGHHYQVWVLRVGSETMESVGVFTARGDFEHEFRLPGRGRYAAVDVSIEEDGGDPEHSGRSLGAGTFG